ncbi:hypothetical protein A6U87_20840 [Rhizobium sp. AC44/96]|uniref:hypothetical protein n=1 Tax=Rhizobium sp. AC44/96 TaxID=1841654 RepID=UPI000810015E|nr:hypothetical protein [Rhizobium sp. AC44/96]OCJ17254.1 hypothetical protein A6U87_20840 [Rhizobium sp. AC44/96]
MSKAEEGHVIISKAVQKWYRHYQVAWDDEASSFLCDAALKLYDNGFRSVEEVADRLIKTYVGVPDTRVNACS